MDLGWPSPEWEPEGALPSIVLSHGLGILPTVDHIEDAALKSALERACEDATGQDFESITTVASSLRQAAGGDDDPLRAVIAGLEYHLVLDEERRAPHGPFGPMMEAAGRSYPASLAQIDELVPGVYALWERAMGLSPIPLVRARFADLLWEARYGDRPHEYAQLAIDAYSETVADGFGHPVEISEAVQRAVEIASRINDPGRRSRAIEAAVVLTESALASEERMPGVALPLLELFVSDRPDRRPGNLDELLVEAVERYGDDPWNLESSLELQARLVPLGERDALRRRVVEAFHDLARKSKGLVRYAHLQHAIELAEEHGLRSLADSIRSEVEGLADEDLELSEVSAEISVPREEVEAFIEWFVGDDDIRSALIRFGAHVPSGDPEENREYVKQLMANHPLQFLFTRMTIGPENSLVRSTTGEDEQAESALVDHEAQRASIFSIFAVDILERMHKRYGAIADCADWFESAIIEPAVARRFGRAIELYEAGDADSAAAVIAPRLERVVRRIAGSVGLTVTRSPDKSGRSGGVKGLGELLGLLEGSLHEPTRRYLRVLLSEVTALNLRNRIGHGLDDEIARRETALLIQAACHLRLLSSGESPGPAAD